MSEVLTLTTFTDPVTSATILVATDVITGAPISVTFGADSLPPISTHGEVTAWAAQVNGHTLQVNTFGGFPGMTANAAS